MEFVYVILVLALLHGVTGCVYIITYQIIMAVFGVAKIMKGGAE